MTRTIQYGRVGGLGTRPQGPSDGYLERLVKYVPAEVLAFFLPAVAIAGPNRSGLVLACLFAGLLATPIWLGVHALGMPSGTRPLPHYYFLACIAFVAWAIGASNAVQIVFVLDAVTVTIILAIVVLLLPAVDILLSATGW